jgi:hypothetical protein
MTVAVGLGGAFADSTAISVSGLNDGLCSPCPYPQHHQHAPPVTFHHTWSLKPSLAPIAPSSLIVLSVCVSSTDCWPSSLKPLSLHHSLTPSLSGDNEAHWAMRGVGAVALDQSLDSEAKPNLPNRCLVKFSEPAFEWHPPSTVLGVFCC